MSRSCRAIAAAWWLVLGLTLDLSPSRVWAQFGVPPAELSSAVSMDEADSAVRAHLERARAYVADRQYDEAVETLRQVMESHGAKMVPLAPGRYVNLADYCHVQISALPPEALALYRQRVDPVAETWYREGLERHSAARLAEVVDQMFCSSWGDDALWILGEIELEQGHYGAARTAWQRLIEAPPARVPAEKFTAALAEPDLPLDQRALLEKW